MNFPEDDLTLDDIYVQLAKEETVSNMNNNFTYTFEKPGEERNWKLLNHTTTIYSELSNLNQKMNTFISLKTRSEPELKGIPDKIFSSLKYTCEFKIPKSLVNGEVLLAKIQVVDSYKPSEEILNKHEHTILKGVSDFISLSVDVDGIEFNSSVKFQFIDNSFRHEKRYFSLKISFFESQNVSSPLFVILSPPFKVYARRPQNTENVKETSIEQKQKQINQQSNLNKKRKIEIIQNEKDFQSKIKKMNNPPTTTSTIYKFESTLDILSKQFDSLSEFEKVGAYESLKRKFPKLEQPTSSLLTQNIKTEEDIFGLTDPEDSLSTYDFNSYFLVDN
eukprot:gene12214-5801_t